MHSRPSMGEPINDAYGEELPSKVERLVAKSMRTRNVLRPFRETVFPRSRRLISMGLGNAQNRSFRG